MRQACRPYYTSEVACPCSLSFASLAWHRRLGRLHDRPTAPRESAIRPQKTEVSGRLCRDLEGVGKCDCVSAWGAAEGIGESAYAHARPSCKVRAQAGSQFLQYSTLL